MASRLVQGLTNVQGPTRFQMAPSDNPTLTWFTTDARSPGSGLALNDVKQFEDENNDQAEDSQPNKGLEVDPRSATESHELRSSI
jgi:hypothetical protein